MQLAAKLKGEKNLNAPTLKEHTLRRILIKGLWAADERSVSIRVSECLRCLVV